MAQPESARAIFEGVLTLRQLADVSFVRQLAAKKDASTIVNAMPLFKNHLWATTAIHSKR